MGFFNGCRRRGMGGCGGYMAVCGGEVVVIGGEMAVRTVMASADVELLNINKVKNYAVFTFFRKFAEGKHKTE